MIECPLCGKMKVKTKYRVSEYRIAKCLNCSYFFLFPFPNNTEDLYDDNYFNKYYIDDSLEILKINEKLKAVSNYLKYTTIFKKKRGNGIK